MFFLLFMKKKWFRFTLICKESLLNLDSNKENEKKHKNIIIYSPLL